MEKIEKLEDNIVNALIAYVSSTGHDSIYHAIGDIEPTNELRSIVMCFSEAWDRADSDDDQELDRILDYYTGEVIKWLKANGLYEHALNHTSFSLS